MPPEDNDDLGLYWDALGIGPQAQETPPSFDVPKNVLAIGTSRNRILVTIGPTGELTYGPGYSPDESAVIFWEALARRRQDYEARLVFYAGVEQMLVQLGTLDIELERLRARATSPEATPQDTVASQAVWQRLDRLVNRIFEFARGLARREPSGEPTHEPPA